MQVLQETDELVRQFDHLTRNGCQLILSLIELEKSGVSDPASLRLLNATARRVGSVFTVIDCFDRQGEPLVDLAEITRRIVSLCIEANRSRANHCVLVVEFDSLHALPEVAVDYALAASELIANALEHAFPDTAGGTISMALERTDRGACFSVRDNGIGTADCPPSKGLGFSLVRSLADELGGSFDLANDQGTLASFDFSV